MRRVCYKSQNVSICREGVGDCKFQLVDEELAKCKFQLMNDRLMVDGVPFITHCVSECYQSLINYQLNNCLLQNE